jgi:ABC-type uncharacterized transport system fused permease/ATPase subunit
LTGFEKLKPMESAAGAWRFTNVQAALQEITNISRKMQHPVVSPLTGTIDIAFGFDEASSGISVFTAALFTLATNTAAATFVIATFLV